MAHIEKYTQSALGRLLNHYERKQDDMVNRSNECIDNQRTGLNYNLAQQLQPLPSYEYLKKRCSEVKVQKRKDVNLMCDWLVTVPKDLPSEEHSDFFKSSFEFLSKRYGSENVLSAYVHLDETTPHMHFAFVPVTEDKKKGGFKVSAKEVITRTDLRTFHTDLQEHLENALGHTVNVLNQATSQGNKSIMELKCNSLEEKINSLEQQLQQSENQLEDLQGRILTQQEVNAIEGKTSIFGTLKNVKYKEYLALKRTAETVNTINSAKEEIQERLSEIIEKEKYLQETEKKIKAEKEEIKNINAQIEKIKAEKMQEWESQCDVLCEQMLADTIIECNKRIEIADKKYKQLNLLKRALEIPLDADLKQVRDELISRGKLQAEFTVERIRKGTATVSDGISTEYIQLSDSCKETSINKLKNTFAISEKYAEKLFEQARKQAVSTSLSKKIDEKQKELKTSRFSVADLKSDKYAPRSHRTAEEQEQYRSKNRGAR